MQTEYMSFKNCWTISSSYDFQAHCNVPKDVSFPRLLYRDSRCFQSCRWRTQVLPGVSSALPDLSSELPDWVLALPDLSSALPDLSSMLPDLSSALLGFSPALPGAPRCTQCSLQCFEVFWNLSQLLEWHSSTSHQRSQAIWRPAAIPAYGRILSRNWRI